MTEMVGYDGPIYMTVPTKAIAPILLVHIQIIFSYLCKLSNVFVSLQEDMRKVAVERKGETNFFTTTHIKECMKKVIAVTLHQTVQV